MYCILVTGIPASGKSTLARALGGSCASLSYQRIP